MPRTFTIHDLDAPVAEMLARYANSADKSLNQAVKELLSSALGVSRSPKARRDNGLGRFCGSLSDKVGEELLKFVAEAEFSRVDAEDR